MNRLFLLPLFTAFSILNFPAAVAGPIADKYEISLSAMMAPVQGYDDNDNIEIVVHGDLPNACYDLGETRIERVERTDTFVVRQFAWRKLGGICAEETKMPDELQMRVPFTRTVSIGELTPGAYQFVNQDPVTQKIRRRTVEVAAASSSSRDEAKYATVRALLGNEMISEDQRLIVKVAGFLSSSCAQLRKIAVDRQGDTLVLLPVVEMAPSVLCQPVIKNFEYKLDLGHFPTGHVLVHARSAGGQSVNQIVEVLEQNDSLQY